MPADIANAISYLIEDDFVTGPGGTSKAASCSCDLLAAGENADLGGGGLDRDPGTVCSRSHGVVALWHGG
jgi:hypothetical protein